MAEGSRSRLLAFAVAVHALAHRSATQRFEALRLRKEVTLARLRAASPHPSHPSQVPALPGVGQLALPGVGK